MAATYNMIGTAIHPVRQGMGCGFCLSELAQAIAADDLTFRPIEPKIAVHLSLVTKRTPISPLRQRCC